MCLVSFQTLTGSTCLREAAPSSARALPGAAKALCGVGGRNGESVKAGAQHYRVHLR